MLTFAGPVKWSCRKWSTRMSTTVVSRSFTNFAALKNEFVQDPNISALAKATALLLQSCPPAWIIRPTWIQKTLSFGDHVWRRVSKELINYGYLKLISGGERGGSYYVFNAWDEPEDIRRIEQSKEKSDPLKINVSGKKRPVDFSQVGKINALKQNINNINKQKTTTEEVVVDISFFDDFKDEIKIKHDEIKRLVSKYGSGKVKEKLILLRETMRAGTPIRNPGGWLKTALERNFEPPMPKKLSSPYPTLEESQKQYRKLEEMVVTAQTKESKLAAKEHLRQLKKMFGKYEDDVMQLKE